MVHQMISLDRSGDLTLGWEDEDRALVLPMIEAKMKAGVTFFVVESESRQVRLQRIGQLGEGVNQVVIHDQDAHALLMEGVIGIVASADSHAPVKTTRRARTAEEVASNDTVAVRPARGG